MKNSKRNESGKGNNSSNWWITSCWMRWRMVWMSVSIWVLMVLTCLTTWLTCWSSTITSPSHHHSASNHSLIRLTTDILPLSFALSLHHSGDRSVRVYANNYHCPGVYWNKRCVRFISISHHWMRTHPLAPLSYNKVSGQYHSVVLLFLLYMLETSSPSHLAEWGHTPRVGEGEDSFSEN